MDALIVGIRFGLYLDLMVLLGIAAFALYGLRGAERVSVLPIAAIIGFGAVAGVALSVLWFLALAADMGGTALWPVDWSTLSILLAETSMGPAWIVRIAALLLVAAAAPAMRSERRVLPATILALIGAGVAVATLAWGGHGTMGEGSVGWLHLAGDVLHLFASAVWTGALVALTLLVLGARDRARLSLAHRALAGFSRIGTIVVAVLVLTGVVNLFSIVDSAGILALPWVAYGQLLIAKLLLFAAMLGLAASNRFRLVLRFEAVLGQGDQAAARAALCRSLVTETACAVAILALVAWFGTLDPAGQA